MNPIQEEMLRIVRTFKREDQTDLEAALNVIRSHADRIQQLSQALDTLDRQRKDDLGFPELPGFPLESDSEPYSEAKGILLGSLSPSPRELPAQVEAGHLIELYGLPSTSNYAHKNATAEPDYACERCSRLDSLLDEMAKNPPGYEGIETLQGRLGNAHIDLGWLAAVKMLKAKI